MPIAIFNSKGERQSITWQGYDFNAPLSSYATFNGGEQEGCFTDAVTYSTPINYQSEVMNELAKQGGGIEYYNPRIASRVLNIRARLQMASLEKLHEHISAIQGYFSPMYLQYLYSGWPVRAGRPEWTDPWTTLYLPLAFTQLTDATMNTGFASYVADGIPLQHSVAPLALPDPPISSIGQGWGATLELSWLLLDGGIAMSQSITTASGTSVNTTPVWSTIPLFPKIEFTTTGVPASNLTVALSSADPNLVNGTIVLKADSLTSGKNVDIIVRDREVYVDGVINNALISSATWPMISPAYQTTIAWTNTTNTTTQNVKYYEAISA